MYNLKVKVITIKELFYLKNEFSPDVMTLVDDDGKEHTFEILDAIENDNGFFYALFPQNEKSNSDSSYYIFELIEDKGEQVLAEVQDTDLLNELAKTFESHFEDFYEVNEADMEEHIDKSRSRIDKAELERIYFL